MIGSPASGKGSAIGMAGGGAALGGEATLDKAGGQRPQNSAPSSFS